MSIRYEGMCTVHRVAVEIHGLSVLPGFNLKRKQHGIDI